ncbi:MAG: glycosyltransferase family 8 protein [Methanobrevibacter sp. CfCl-M3]
MNLLLVSDENYAMQLTVLMTSILNNNYDDFDEINFYILSNNITDSSLEKIRSLETIYEKINLIIISNTEIEKKLEDIKDKLPSSDKSTSYYYRMFAASILPNVDKILYMDVDIVTNGSLIDLYNTSVDSYYGAGVIDINETGFKEELNMDPNDIYVNSGVLLMNLQKWREDNIQDQIIDFINKTTNKELLYDQHIINHTLKNNIKVLEPKNNVLTHMSVLPYKRFMGIFRMKDHVFSEKEYNEAHTNPVCIHFITSPWRRPWESNCKHPYIDLFFKYKNLSPFADHEIKYRVMPESYMWKAAINRFIFTKFPVKLAAYMNKHNILNLKWLLG